MQPCTHFTSGTLSPLKGSLPSSKPDRLSVEGSMLVHCTNEKDAIIGLVGTLKYTFSIYEKY